MAGENFCCSVAQSCLTLCNPMDCSMPALSFTSSRVCSNTCALSWWCNPTISSSLPSSPHALHLSQHQRLFQCIGSLHQVAKLLELQLQHQSFQWTFGADFLQDWLVWSPCSPRDSQQSCPAPQFKSIKISKECLNPSFLMSFAFMMTEEIEVLPASAIFIHNLARKQLSC